MSRELTRDERRAIRRLVTGECANYGEESGCLPLGCPCCMLGKWWTGTLCGYFKSSVLPLDPKLETAMAEDGPPPDMRACKLCGRLFLPTGRQAYCSHACKADGNRRKSRERVRKMRRKNKGLCYD